MLTYLNSDKYIIIPLKIFSHVPKDTSFHNQNKVIFIVLLFIEWTKIYWVSTMGLALVTMLEIFQWADKQYL